MADLRGPLDGPVLRGKIKVDARKARGKLRDHMLVDPHLYGCEIGRAAVALSASILDIDYDADDVVFTFACPNPPASELLARLRDHVLTPSDGTPHGDALRLLGIAVSAALSQNPLFVDVYRADATTCTRARFEPDDAGEDAADAPLEAPKADLQSSRPEGMAKAGNVLRVHVRYRIGISLIGRAFKRDIPREVALLTNAARDSSLDVRVAGKPARTSSKAPEDVLLRVSLDEPALTSGYVEILRPGTNQKPDSCMLFAERGIHLARYGLFDCWNVVREEGELPVRIRIDAPSLPTNASRSAIRMDGELAQRILARVAPALAVAVRTLEQLAGGAVGETARPSATADVGHTVHVLSDDRVALLDALGMIVTEVAIACRHGSKSEPVAPDALRLLSLPLLADVFGSPLALSALEGGTPEVPLRVYSGPGPLPRTLETWLAGVVWLRGTAAERAIASLNLVSANDLVVQAQEAFTRRSRALTHPPSKPELPPGDYVVREAFHVTSGPFEGLAGEVGVTRVDATAPSHYRRSATARLFVDDRLLEMTQLPGVSLPVELALSWPRGIRARFAYDGVERDESLSRALLYALRVAAIAIGERAMTNVSMRAEPELVRHAIVAWASSTRTLGDGEINTKTLGKLASVPAWPTACGKLVSLADLESYALRTSAICVAPRGPEEPPDGRPVLDAKVTADVKTLLPKSTKIVAYERALRASPNASRDKIAKDIGDSPAVAIHRRNVEGFLAIGGNRMRVYHAGVLLQDRAYTSRNGSVQLVVEDDAAVPTADFTGLLWSTPLSGMAREEDALVDLVASRCEEGEVELSTDVASYLETSRRRILERIEDWKKKKSRKSGEGAAPGEEREDDELTKMRATVQRLAELPHRLARRKLEIVKAALLARPRVDVDAILGAGPRATVRTPQRGTVTVVAARDHLRAELLYRGHPITSTFVSALPLAAVVDIESEELLADWAELTAEGSEWMRSMIIDAALKLVLDLAHTPTFASDTLALDLWLALAQTELVRVWPALMASRWPTVQNTLAALPEEPGMLPVARQIFSSYRPPASEAEESPYDAATFHVGGDALGDVRRRVLITAGYTLNDVTDAVARLQARRARGARTPPPKLDGAPSHPLVRMSLAELGATHLEGELELLSEELDWSSPNTCRVRDGAFDPIRIALPVPVKIIYRCDEGVATHVITSELAMATERAVRTFATNLDDAPLFLRAHLRRLVCAAAMRQTLSDLDRSVPVFQDTTGGWHSLATLQTIGKQRATQDGPPWPALPEGMGGVLHLSYGDMKDLNSIVEIEDVTENLRAIARGAARRALPPLATIELGDDLRAKCLLTFRIEGLQDGFSGEVGLLRPAHAALRAVAVYTTNRHVTNIADPDGWPIVATVNVDVLEPSLGFDALANPRDESRIHSVLRLAIGTRMLPLLTAPADVRGVMRLPSPFLVRAATSPSSRPVACMGVFWVEHEWPESPELHVEGVGVVDPNRAPSLPAEEGGHHRLLPVRGRLYVSADARGITAAVEEVCRWIKHRLPPIFRATSRSSKKANARATAAYEWDLALLGMAKGEGDTCDPILELAKDRPDEVLVYVATRRAPHLMVPAQGDGDRLGGAPLLSEELEAMVAAREKGEADDAMISPANLGALRSSPAAPSPSPSLSAAQRDEAMVAAMTETFLGGLVRRIVSLVTGPEPPPSKRSSALTNAVAAALRAMKLTGDPVTDVVESRRGRAISYDKDTCRVIINTRHECVRALAKASVTSEAASQASVLFLLIAAISEINRELVPVTDAEELAILMDLLRAQG